MNPLSRPEGDSSPEKGSFGGRKKVKRMVAVCIAVVWIGMLVCIAGMKRTAKEHLRWYAWYALIVSVAATAEMLLIAGSAK